jgi:preprotein translocase subunit SecA
MTIINKILQKFLGSKSEKDMKPILPLVEKINIEFKKLELDSNDALRAKTQTLKQRIVDFIKPEQDEVNELKTETEKEELGFDEKERIYEQIEEIEKTIDKKIEEILREILPEAFAIVKETARRFKENEKLIVKATDFDRNLAARRGGIIIEGEKAIWLNSWNAGGNEVVWDMVHYDVQLIGGTVLHEGKIAEMATGEGKTLVATLPVFLNALTGRGVHIVTVNDYLARRDSEWMGTMFEFHGLSVDCIDKHQPNSEERRRAYLADITYGTNNEFGFDYLRDNMAISPEDLVQRKHFYAIVDEVDSVLIDDARTPLIISGPIPKGDDQLFDEMKPPVVTLVNAQKNLVNQLLVDAKKLINDGKDDEGSFKLLQAYKGLPKNKALIKFLSEKGNKALMKKTEDIYLAENAKRMPEVTKDLFFVIEEQHNSIELTDKGIDLLSTNSNDANFFILPDLGSEIAEIEKLQLQPAEKLVKKDKLIADYTIKSERVHTINQLLKAYSLFEKDVEYVVMDNKVKIVDEQTGRILDGRRYSDGLHQAIEAKENVKIEAATQTFATITLQNYFRMYKKLAGMTGTAETEAGELWSIYKLDVVVIPTNKKMIRNDRQDLVYKTTREKYKAVIEEIESLTQEGRPVLVGTTSVEVSELLSRMLKMKNIKHNVLNAKLHQREADIVAEAGQRSTVTIATNMAGRGTDIKLSQDVRKAGGLAILGTERHESRRVDRQLRGRSGRQGDPGSSAFFVSLEDDLMRLFGSDRIARIMDTLGLKEGEVIQHSMITKSIERAQKKVEENNFGIRKRLLEYDDVMNSQREVIYTRRRHALYGERIDVDIANMFFDVCQSVVDEHFGKSPFPTFQLELIRYLAIECPITANEFIKLNSADIVEKVYNTTIETYKRRIQVIMQQALPVITEVYETSASIYEFIVIPISDGNKVYNIRVNLKKAYESKAREVVRAYEKAIVLLEIDDAWKEHLREMDELKQSVQNATYEQKDPLLIYKFESFGLFSKMIDKINKDVISILIKGHIPIRDASQVHQADRRKKLDMSKYKTSKDEYASSSKRGNRSETETPEEPEKLQPIRVEKKIGRNETCPCGSGKKYKQCHGKNELG